MPRMRGKQVDGVVSIDLHAVQLLVGALGPLEIPGADGPVTGDNIIEQIQQFWDQPAASDATIQTNERDWLKQRKDFMPLLATGRANPAASGPFQPAGLAAAATASLWTARAVQVWLPNPDLAAHVLAGAGWDGALAAPTPPPTISPLVDTNMGYNKVDAVLERRLDYTVSGPTARTRPRKPR